MTIALGFMLGNAAVICADSQEVVSDYAKSTTQKIFSLGSSKWRIATVGAGDTACIELCNEELTRKIGSFIEFNYSEMFAVIKETIHEIHEQHVWPQKSANPSFPGFQMLIGLQAKDPGARALLYSQESIVLPVDQFKSIGIGAYLADYLHDRLFPGATSVYSCSAEEATRIGIFILKEVKSAIHGCDGETLVAVLHGDGNFRWMLGPEIHETESWFAAFHGSELALIQTVVNAEMQQEEFDRRLLQVSADMKLLRTRQARDAETQASRFADFLKAQNKATKTGQSKKPGPKK